MPFRFKLLYRFLADGLLETSHQTIDNLLTKHNNKIQLHQRAKQTIKKPLLQSMSDILKCESK